jgi:quinol monooxygenase YgiN
LIPSLIEITPLPHKRGETLRVEVLFLRSPKRKIGMPSSEVYEAGDEKPKNLYLERWRSKEELHRHIRSNLYLGILNVTDLAQEPACGDICPEAPE